MSMFHELMMRKKEQIMYATIKGTLTENDGVFSGFSTSNYLEIPNVPTYTQDDKIEFVTNFTLTTLNDSTLCGGAGAFCVPVVSSDGKIQYFGSVISLTGQKGTNILVVNQNYYFKAIYDTNSFKGYISTDGINWILDYSKSVSVTFSKSGAFQLGRKTNVSTQYLKGSMNLNKSYIKINSTKYNLQAVVGYTIVGSPTITDGVVSGFTTSDYVRTSQDWDTFADAETWKIHTRIITGENYNTTRSTGVLSSQGFQAGFGVSISGKLVSIIYLSDNSQFSLISSLTIESNTSYDIELEKTKSQYIFRVKKTNTVTWEEKTNNSTLLVRNNFYNPNYLYFGNVNYFNVVFTGSIDMNETIIFVNNKLYFNGQQA